MIESGAPRHTGEDSLTVQLPRFGVFIRKKEFCKQQVSYHEPAKNLDAARANLRSMSLLIAPQIIASAVSGRRSQSLLNRRDRSIAAPGGQETGKNPTGKGKSGSKRHVVVDRGGIPLSVTHSGANVHDSQALEEAVGAIYPITHKYPA